MANQNDNIYIDFDADAETIEQLKKLNELTPEQLQKHVALLRSQRKHFLILRIQVWDISTQELVDDYDARDIASAQIDSDIADDITDNGEPDAQVRAVIESFQKIDLDAYVRSFLKKE